MGQFQIQGAPANTRMEVMIIHPDYALNRVYLKPDLDNIIRLTPGGILEGRVVDSNQQPVNNIAIAIQGAGETIYWDRVRTGSM